MKRQRIVFTVASTLLLLAIASIWPARRADAIIIVNSKGADTGMFAITANQTARVHVVNGSGFAADDPLCVVQVRFYDSAGTILGQNQIKMPAGRADFVDYTDPTLSPGQAERKHIRAVVQQMLPREFDSRTPICIMTAEVFDNRTGQAGIIIINSHPVQ